LYTICTPIQSKTSSKLEHLSSLELDTNSILA
jgi:hypothetical protein